MTGPTTTWRDVRGVVPDIWRALSSAVHFMPSRGAPCVSPLNEEAAADLARPAPLSLLDASLLCYLGLPTLVYLVGWIAPQYGIPAAVALVLGCGSLIRGKLRSDRTSLAVTLVIVTVGVGWSLLGGVGHFVYANFDWTFRDAVLLDLVQRPWPVIYDYGPRHLALLLRAPIGLYMPSAVIGKLFGVRAADVTMFVWVALGVVLVFKLLLRDEWRLNRIAIRLGVFVIFSGMDIVGTMSRGTPVALGQHIEWWAYLYQYPSITTQLFWAPGHAVPGWLVVAWLLGRGERRLPIPFAVSLMALLPMWSPLAAIGVAPIMGVAIAKELRGRPIEQVLRSLFDVRSMACVLVCLALVYPYLTLGTEILDAGFNSKRRWVGEDFLSRYLEFVVLEFALVAALLLYRFRGDTLLIAAIVTLLAIPIYHFGPANDLALRASNPGLALLALRLGEWLSEPSRSWIDARTRGVAIVLLVIGAVTPFLEVSRLFTETRWDMNTEENVIVAAHGRSAAHYLTPLPQPWTDRFLK